MRETESSFEINERVFVEKRHLELMPGEMTKTSEALNCINAANCYMGKYLSDLGLDQMPVVIPEQFHVLSEFSHYDYFSEEPDLRRRPALCYPGVGLAIFNEGGFWSCDEEYKSLFHESIHLMQMQKYREQSFLGMRSEIDDYEEQENSHNFLAFITEAMVDRVLMEMSEKYKREIVQMVESGNRAELRQLFGTGLLDEASFYFFHIEVLNNIVAGIAKINNERHDDVWKRFKKSFFESNVDHLKEIKSIFGERVVAIINAGFSLDPNVCPVVLKYFETDDKQEREKTADEILKQ